MGTVALRRLSELPTDLREVLLVVEVALGGVLLRNHVIVAVEDVLHPAACRCQGVFNGVGPGALRIVGPLFHRRRSRILRIELLGLLLLANGYLPRFAPLVVQVQFAIVLLRVGVAVSFGRLVLGVHLVVGILVLQVPQLQRELVVEHPRGELTFHLLRSRWQLVLEA